MKSSVFLRGRPVVRGGYSRRQKDGYIQPFFSVVMAFCNPDKVSLRMIENSRKKELDAAIGPCVRLFCEKNFTQ